MSADPAAGRTSGGRALPFVLLWLVLGASLALRLWGIAFAGSTPIGRPDEEIFAVEGLAMFVRPYSRLSSGWPDGFFTVWHAMLWLERAWFHLVYGEGPVNLGCLLTVRPLAVILPIRVLSALLGTATAYVVGRIAAALSPSRAREAAVWGTAIYGVNYLVGRDGHFAVSDTALCLGVALTLLACTRAAAGSLAWVPWAGFFAGCSFSVKYSGVGLLVPCVVAGAITVRRRGRDAIRPLLWAVTAALLGTALLAPQALTHWTYFRRGVLGGVARYDLAAATQGVPGGWLFYPLTVLPASFGVPGLLLCVGGAVFVIRRIRWTGLPLVTYAVAFYALLLGPLHMVFVRYGSPIVPPLAACGGAFAVGLVDRACARVGPRRAAVTAALATLTLTLPAVQLARFDRLLGRPDTRDLAREWLVARGDGKTVLTEGAYGHVQAIEAGHARVCQAELPAALWQPTPVLAAALQSTPSGAGEAGWTRIGHDGTFWYVLHEGDQRLSLPDLHEAAAPDFLVQARGPRSLAYFCGEKNWGPRDPACWREAAHFSPGDLDAPEWDTYDAFFTPFTGFSSLERPGPEIFVYENRCKRAGS